jgi:transposase
LDAASPLVPGNGGPDMVRAFPEHLPREEVKLDLNTRACPSCGGALHPIGETTSEMLDWVPASLRIIRIRRPKYGCRACGTIHQVAAPERLIAKGMATPGLIAQVLVSKYGDHMPLHMAWNVALTAPPANSAAGQTPRRPQYGCAVRLHRSILSSTASEPDRQRKSTDTRRHAQRDWDRGESGPHRQWQKGPAASA